jgi:hypothetical protein
MQKTLIATLYVLNATFLVCNQQVTGWRFIYLGIGERLIYAGLNAGRISMLAKKKRRSKGHKAFVFLA